MSGPLSSTAHAEPSWPRKVGYAGAQLSGGLFTMAFMTLLMIYYSPPGGSGREELMPITLTGFVLSFGRILDSFFEPVVAYLSDRTRSRFGRRIPWITLGSIPLCAFFFGLWYVPDFVKAPGTSKAGIINPRDEGYCMEKIGVLRAQHPKSPAAWADQALTTSWAGRCGPIIGRERMAHQQRLCLDEMEHLKIRALARGESWQTMVRPTSKCTSYGAGCPLFPKDQKMASAGTGGHGEGGAFAQVKKDLAKYWKVALWLAVMSSGFWLGFTAVFLPHLSLMPVVAVTDKSRMSINLIMAIFNILGVLVMQLIRPVFVTLGFGDLSLSYFFSLTLICGFSILLTPLLIREPKRAGQEHHYGFIQSLKWTFTNKAFMIYLLSNILYNIGFTGVLGAIEYIVRLLLHREPNDLMPLVYLTILGAVMISFAAMMKLSERFEKRHIFTTSLFALGLTTPLLYLLGNSTILGFPVIIVAFVLFALIGLPVAGVMSLQNALVADIVDEDEMNNGYRREGMFFGAMGLIGKFTAAAVPLMTAWMFNMGGYCHPDSPSNMGVRLLGPGAGLFVLLGAVAFLFYPIREKALRKRREAFMAQSASSE